MLNERHQDILRVVLNASAEGKKITFSQLNASLAPEHAYGNNHALGKGVSSTCRTLEKSGESALAKKVQHTVTGRHGKHLW